MLKKSLGALSISLLLTGVLFFTSSQAATATYYVSPTGNDKNAGTLTSPWKTIQKAANTVTAGNTVIVQPGVYKERVKFAVSPNHSGTVSNPVIFKSSTPSTAQIVGGFDTRNANHLIIDGFKITSLAKGGTGGGVLVGSNNVTIINNYFYDIPDAAVRGYDSTKVISDIIVKDNVMALNQYGVIVVGERWSISNNDLSLKNWGATSLNYFQFSGNNLSFRNNYLHGTNFSQKGLVSVVGWKGSATSKYKINNVEISGNLVQAFDQGINLTSSVVGNLNAVSVFNNVFDGVWEGSTSIGGYGVYAQNNVSNLIINHNTFANLSVAAVRLAGKSGAISQNNIFYQAGNGYYKDALSTFTGGYNLLTSSTTLTFKNSNDLMVANPLFLNPDKILGVDNIPRNSDDGFRLDPLSPALNKGVVSSFNLDITGMTRPLDLLPDLGAYEVAYTVVDNVAPTTTAFPGGGTYSSVVGVFLQINEEDKDTSKTYYCFDLADNTTPCEPKTLVEGSITISASGTIRFYSVDEAGNEEVVKAETYVINIDTTPPITTIYPVSGSYPLNTLISFFRNEGGKTFYCLIVDCLPDQLYISPFNLNNPLTVRFYSVDEVGNEEAIKEGNYSVITSVISNTESPPPVTTTTSSVIEDTASSSPQYSELEQIRLIKIEIEKEEGGGSAGQTGNIIFSSSTLSTTSAESSSLIPLQMKVIELQKILLNLLEQIFQKGKTTTSLMESYLAGVGDLFLGSFEL